MKTFRDNTHGYIEVPDCIVQRIIDTELFQRLQDIEQTGMRPLYPAARHNRFIHSLGVYHLGKLAFSSLRANATKAMSEHFPEDLSKLGSGERSRLESSGVSFSAFDSLKANGDEDRVNLLSEAWWDKYEVLLSLACLLHDCAHAPFSHTYEMYYTIGLSTLDDEFFERTKASEIWTSEFELKDASVASLDKTVLMQFTTDEFWRDYLLGSRDKPRIVTKLEPNCEAKPHEKLSSAMIGIEYRGACRSILEELLPGNPFVQEEGLQHDVEFMARAIMGMPYDSREASDAVERSFKNCFISLLNSNIFDVDGVDYTVRDAKNAGLGTGSVDYQRLFKSLTVARVEVYDAVAFENDSVNGLWLGESSFFSPKHQKGLQLELDGLVRLTLGPFNKRGMFSPDSSADKNMIGFSKDNVDGWLECSKGSIDSLQTGNAECRVSLRSAHEAPPFRFTSAGTVRACGDISGLVNGKRICQPGASTNGVGVATAPSATFYEYIPVYNQSCLSVIDHVISARNFEYQWIYAHHQVMYNGFLLCFLPRLASRFQCCAIHNEQVRFGTIKRSFDSCYVPDESDETSKRCSVLGGSVPENTGDPDFLVPILLGFEEVLDDDVNEDFALLRERFCRSGDSDIRALFKQVRLENSRLGECASDKVEQYCKMFFSRKHQKALWKTRAEFDAVLSSDEFTPSQKKELMSYFAKRAKTSQVGFKFPDDAVAQVFKRHGIDDVVAIPAQVNLKKLAPYAMHIELHGPQIVRLVDAMDSQATVILEEAPDSSFFYVFGTCEEGRSFDVKELQCIFNEALPIIRKLAKHQKLDSQQ